LLDWEEYQESAPAFFDIWHYLIQSHALLERPSRAAILRGLDGKGAVGQALRNYSAAAGLDPRLARESLLEYLELSSATLDLDRADGRSGLAARTALLKSLGSR
jgi:hypothetical protein